MARADSAEAGTPTATAFALTNFIDITTVSGRSSKSPLVRQREERISRFRRKYRYAASVQAFFVTATLKLESHFRAWNPWALIQISPRSGRPGFAFVHISTRMSGSTGAGKENVNSEIFRNSD